MNKYVYAATMIGLFSVTTNGYTVDVTTNQSQEAANIINITANRTALLDLDTPVSTSVITQEDIQNSGAKTAFDAVANVPGVTINSFSASGADFGGMDSRTNIRGLDRGALVLVNGVPMNLNGKSGIGSIPTSAIEAHRSREGGSLHLIWCRSFGWRYKYHYKDAVKRGRFCYSSRGQSRG